MELVWEKIKEFWKWLRLHFTTTVALILIVISSVIMMGVNYFMRPTTITVSSFIGSVMTPFQKGFNEIGNFFYGREEEKKSLKEAEEYIKELEKERDALNIKINDYSSLARENKELRDLLNAKEKLVSYDTKAATVIGNSGINVFRRFTINLGSEDGMKVNMNVVNRDGLIGIITYVGLNYSIVTSVIEDNASVAVMTKNGHENCIVKGSAELGESKLLLENVKASVELEEDFALVTSNISDKYLPGIMVGYVDEIIENKEGLTKRGTVKTAVDFTRIKEVLVITTLREELKETPNE